MNSQDNPIAFSAVKSAQLREQRGIGFEEILHYMRSGKLLETYPHPSPAYAHQRIAAVDVEGYVYLVPYVHTEGALFLKTIYPSRKATRRYRRKHEA